MLERWGLAFGRRAQRGVLAAGVVVAVGLVTGSGWGIGKLTRVSDGDTIGLGGVRSRIWGVDAPEIGQICRIAGRSVRIGLEAKRFMTDLVSRGELRCDRVGNPDRYDRPVLRCWIRGADVAEMLTRAGWAWDDPAFSGGAYAAAEAQARAAGLGVWGGHCETPWDYKRRQRRHG